MTESGAATPAKELVTLADTADLYATATGLIERSAAAFASGVPEGPGDDGFFGPASVTWRMSGDLASPVAGLRSLLMQALHPLAMAGVDQHSGWRREPVGRLAATMAYLTTITFGDRAAAMRAAGRVRRIHDHVHGTDAVTGRPYAAGDPALLLWVHGADAISTGSPWLDRLLAGPGFLDAGAFPEVSFRSDLLAWVPAGWRAVGHLQVKDTEHELACRFDPRLDDPQPGGPPRLLVAGSLVIDSRWITRQRIPALGRRIVMTCSLSLEPDM